MYLGYISSDLDSKILLVWMKTDKKTSKYFKNQGSINIKKREKDYSHFLYVISSYRTIFTMILSQDYKFQ